MVRRRQSRRAPHATDGRRRGAQALPGPSGLALGHGALTAPYQHDGSEGALTEVVTFYNRGGRDPQSYGKSLDIRPLNLTDSDIHDVVAFLEALTGATDDRLRQ